MLSDAQREGLRSRVVSLCAALPGVTFEDGRHVGLSVRGKRFAWLLDDHHGDGRLAFTCKALPGMNTKLADRLLRATSCRPTQVARLGGLRLAPAGRPEAAGRRRQRA